MPLKVYGKLPSGESLEKIKRSANYKNNTFQNLSKTPMLAEGGSYTKMFRDFLNKPKTAIPPVLLPYVQTDLHQLPAGNPVIIWFGHSSYFIRINEKNILVDPVFGGNASPYSFMISAFKGSNTYGVQDMPVIDHLIITHDHYDHLDHKTIVLLRNKIKHVYCSLGVASHLIYWGYDENSITEMDWWQKEVLSGDIRLTAAPARHFSGRGLTRNKTLWSSFILETAAFKLYLGGDSGYDTHFKIIGEQYGPFDIAMLECGQYNTSWPLIHMMPEETVQAAIDLGAKTFLPVHWGKFSLALHAWNDPIQRAVKSAKENNLHITTPKIGEPVILDSVYPGTSWWDI